MKKISIFASGSGTNAQNIIDYFSKKNEVIVDSVFTNKPDAYVIKRAESAGVKVYVFNRNEFYNSGSVVEKLLSRKVDMVVLAGFLWLIPENMINSFKIINIHPALLPKYGGKGMYGMHVHESVVRNKEKESGITIHYVNEKYDDGQIIFQATCTVDPTDNADDVATKVHQLEYAHFPKIIEQVLKAYRDQIG